GRSAIALGHGLAIGTHARLAIGLGLGAEFVAAGAFLARTFTALRRALAALLRPFAIGAEARRLFGEVTAGTLGLALEGSAVAAFAIGTHARRELAGSSISHRIAATRTAWRTDELATLRRPGATLGTTSTVARRALAKRLLVTVGLLVTIRLFIAVRLLVAEGFLVTKRLLVAER